MGMLVRGRGYIVRKARSGEAVPRCIELELIHGEKKCKSSEVKKSYEMQGEGGSSNEMEGGDLWQASMTHIALEGGCFVLSANQFCRRQDYPPPSSTRSSTDEDISPSRGGSRGGFLAWSPTGRKEPIKNLRMSFEPESDNYRL
ncbi:hypothetical protein IFM89_016411 [Coptis chinensis]|uniref:Uncharacterized protein n=1 Tax=Coptis chinensis TaxID=261450 RepID=A0A835HDU1_9MAGN|nr:hypothetical protein IFM89_016411 [Coptis chinensis]